MMEQCETKRPDLSIPKRSNISYSVLIINEHPLIRKMLVGLINEEPDVDVCLEADNIEVAYRTLDEKTVDFVLVDITSNPRKGTRCAELLKLRCPMMPIMAVSTCHKAANSTRPHNSISPEQTQRILSAIRYMQSLLKCGLQGFTVFVKA